MTGHRLMRGASAAAAGACILAAGACSSSSSPSATQSPTALDTGTADLHGHPAGGPNGIITAPASNPPAPGVPGGSEVFPHIDRQVEHRLANHLLKLPGVVHIAYYPQFHQLQVFYSASASDADREAAYTYVTSHS